MARFQPTQSSTFNALLNQLNETVSELAKLYYTDVEAALKENERLYARLDDGSVSNVDLSKSSVTAFSPEVPEESAPIWEKEANDAIAWENTDLSAAEQLLNETHLQECSPPVVSESVNGDPSEIVYMRKSIEAVFSMSEAEVQSQTSPHTSDDDSSAHLDIGLAKGLVRASSVSTKTKRTRKSARRHYTMRSPWIDQRDFLELTLEDVIDEDAWHRCLNGKASGNKSQVRSSMARVSLAPFALQRGNLNWLVVHPESRVRGYWILVSMVLLLYDFVMIPVDVCFELDETPFSEVVDLSAVTFWTLDIVFTFFVGVRKAHCIETDHFKIARSYLKSWFVFDLFLVFPEWVTLMLSEDNFSGGQVSVFRVARWGRITRLLRMARIMRMGKLKPLMRRLITVLNISRAYMNFMQSLLVLSIGIVSFVHIASCFWYAIGNSSDDGWVSLNGLSSASIGRLYANSVHWTFSRLHGLQTYNNIESAKDLFLDALFIYVSMILAAFFNGTVAAVAMSSANAQSFNLWKLGILFVKRHRISSGLDMKLQRFLETSGINSAVAIAAEEQMLLEVMPKTLQQDLLFEARSPYLSRKRYMIHLLEANPRMIRQLCSEAVTQKVSVDGEIVFAHHDACNGMLFVTSGVLYYILGNSVQRLESIQDNLYNPMSMEPVKIHDDDNMKQLGQNNSMSEPVLWTQWTHLGTLLTIEESTSLLLSPNAFSNIVSEHREAACYAVKYAKYFLWLLNHTSAEVDDLIAFDDQISITDLDTDIFEGTENDHLMFLSHYKVEAGTEATLMRDLFLDILREDPNHAAHDLRAPIFVDSEDLTDLSKLKDHVIGSWAIVLLLTPGVLSRPWCLVEIVTAIEHKVNIVPVEIQRPGSKYNYPDDEFYANIHNGKFLSQSSVDLLESEGISLKDVDKAIRQLFLKIALPFSPHKTKGVREAELLDILSRITPSQDSGGTKTFDDSLSDLRTSGAAIDPASVNNGPTAQL